MTKTLELKLGWITLQVTVDVSDDGIEQVLEVRAEGSKEPLKCDLVEFLKCFESELADLLEEAKRDDYVAYCEMRYDTAKEEGLL